jgi:CheY-like chemotaxis protein
VKPAAERDLEREISRSLVGALEVALSAGGALAELRAARDAAQLLELPGLDRLISALAPHASHPWPAEIQPVVERLQRVCSRATSTGGLAEFRRADSDFHGLAGEIVAMEWSALPSRGGAEGPSVPTLSAAEMLSDLPLAGEMSASVARRARITMPVAAAVRAALDWLAGREGVRQPLELREDASALEVVCELRDAAGVPPAHDVLSGVDGNLGPPLAAWGQPREGAWILRVPSFSSRPAYVMLEQGPLRLAVPWHAVLKLLVAPRDAIAARAARLGMSVLPPISPLSGRGLESPVVIVAHGLRRAWMVADRLVWRLPADPCEPDERLESAGLARAVSTDEGEIFGLVEPGPLLAGTPLPPLPRVAAPRSVVAEPRTLAPRKEIEVLDERWVTPLPAIEIAPNEAVAHAPNEAERPADSTEPEAGSESGEPAAGGEPGGGPEATAGITRRALVAEDSITARIFLTRLLEQQGFEVVAVERAAELNAALAVGPWSLTCVDVELPDAHGAALLRGVRERLPEQTPLVALVRDDHDIATARIAGVWRTLLKPVEPGALRRLLARLGFAERASG